MSMLVYGKLERTVAAADAQVQVACALRSAAGLPAGIDRHAAIVDAFIQASEFVQGCADREFEKRGVDAPSTEQRQGAMLLHLLGQTLDRSWREGFGVPFEALTLEGHLSRLTSAGTIRIRSAEGYAHYALYPESYCESARRSGLDHRSCVIGIRSVGLGLAGLVSAVLGAAPPVSLRPTGHPFRREIRAAPDLLAGEVKDKAVQFAVVDEGPGLSGSSFACVAQWLMSRGVAAHRIHFFPGHDNPPGSAASADIRSIWASIRRHPARQEDVLLHHHLHPVGLRSWIAEKLGPPTGELRDVSSGEWRYLCGKSSMPLPPCDSRFERRKFLVTTGDREWLVKFAGLGSLGQRKYADTLKLAGAGFVPQAVALCHGFIIQKWAPQHAALPVARDQSITKMGEYLAFRARHFTAAGQGASLETLRDMAIHNTEEGLGPTAAAQLGLLLRDVHILQRAARPVRTDNRLHRWEWLWSDEQMMKADAVDHCQAHDLVGCQDIAWDVAGAIVEHDLSRSEIARLCNSVWGGGASEVQRRLLAALIPCYLAFQFGLWTTAVAPDTGKDSWSTADQARLYEKKLAWYLREACISPI